MHERQIFRRRLHFKISEIVAQEGIRCGAPKRVEGSHQIRARAVVGCQCIDAAEPTAAGRLIKRLHIAACPQVGFQIGTAKAVDGLFRIPHEPHGVRFALTQKEAFDDRVLNRIGILKFVHQHHAEGAADTLGQTFRLRPGFRIGRNSPQAFVELNQKIVEGLYPCFAFFLRQTLGRFLHEILKSSGKLGRLRQRNNRARHQIVRRSHQLLEYFDPFFRITDRCAIFAFAELQQ